MKFVVDTNVLLRRADAQSAERPSCGDAVTQLLKGGHDLFVCAQVLIEFRSVATRPIDVNGLGLSVEEVKAQTADLRDVFTCLPELPDMADRWEAVADKYAVLGKQAHDARIAALMIAHGVKHLLTLNPADFARYEEIRAVTPQEILSDQL